MKWFSLLFVLAAGCSDETISGYADRDTVYRLVELNGAPFKARATISFPKPGQVSGEAPCNAWFAEQSVPYPWIKIGPIGATKRACRQLDKEAEFFAALENVSLAEVSGDVLILSSEDGPQMVFRAE